MLRQQKYYKGKISSKKISHNSHVNIPSTYLKSNRLRDENIKV